MSTAYIGIGSNLGNREKNCSMALSRIEQRGMRIVRRSAMIETEPWGVKEQPKFVNMAVQITTDLAPDTLLKTLKKIEADMGRAETARWGPRIIDLDILFYDDVVIQTSELEIPHPGIQERIFVLQPLSEIAPDKIHPVLRKSVQELLNGRSQASEPS